MSEDTSDSNTKSDKTNPETSSDVSKVVLWVNKTRRILLVIGILYATSVVLLCTPFFQRHAIFLHAFKFPLFANFDMPEKYGLAPNKTFNFGIPTPDGESLGAWFILSDKYYHGIPAPPTRESLPSMHIPIAVQKYPTILFLHGNAATRAFHARVQHYTALTSRLGANLLAIDYRGYADSTGTPSEEGLIRDARAAWDWLVRKGVDADQVLIVGQSLGTGVGAGLARQLAQDGIICKGLVLLSPFSSIQDLLHTYYILGLVPLMKPLATIPWATNLVMWALIHKFDTLQAVPEINAPVFIAHAKDDWDIPDSHSDTLFNEFLDAVLPELKLPEDPDRPTKEEYQTMVSSIERRKSARAEKVKRVDMAGFGYMESFWDDSKGRDVTLLKSLHGGHDYLGMQEGVQDAFGRMFGFF